MRQHFFGDQKVVIFGGSWGATLPLLYGEAGYNKNVLCYILRGIFLARKKDISAFLNEDSGAAKNNPAEWARFKNSLGFNEKEKVTYEEIVNTAYKKIQDENWRETAKAFCRWEEVNSCTDEETLKEEIEWSESEDGAIMGRTEIHFIYHNFFIEENQILDNIKKIEAPVEIVQGKHDKVCPPDQAELLYNELLKSGNKNVKIWRTKAGHSASEPENINVFLTITDDFANNSNNNPMWKDPNLSNKKGEEDNEINKKLKIQ